MPLYPPLHLPDDTKDDRGLMTRIRDQLNGKPTPEALHFQHQFESREPIPPAVWGASERATFAKDCCDIVAQVIGWPNANLIPEDPFSVVTHVIGGEDLESDEIAWRFDMLTGRAIDERDWKRYQTMTLGAVIDDLFGDGSSVRALRQLRQPYPIDQPGRVETATCARMAAFLDIRAFLRQPRFFEGATVRPNSNLNHILRTVPLRELEVFVEERFSVVAPRLPGEFRHTLDEVWLGLTATAVSTAMGSCMLAAGLILDGTWDPSALALPLIFLILGLAITGIYSIPFILQWGDPRLNNQFKRRVQTVWQLVDCIVAQRELALPDYVKKPNGS